MTKKILCVITLMFALVCLLASCGDDNTTAHTHSFGEWETTKAATCKEAGTEARYCDCGENQTRETSKTEHEYGEWEITKEATCTEKGSKERFCNCGDRQTAEIFAIGHSYGAWVESKAPTCTLGGEKKRSCACGEKETRSINANGHSYGDWTIIKEAGCTEDGTEERACACGEKETRPILAEHSYEGNACVDCGAKKPSEGLEYKSVTGGYIVEGIGSCNDTDIVIPSTYKGEPVIGIDEWAFDDCDSLTSVVIGDSVTSIGDKAFYYCDSLMSITFGDNILTIGKNAFYDCSNIESIHIKSIEAWCKIKFADAYANPLSQTSDLYVDGNVLTDLVIPYGITVINDYAFNTCRKLKSVTISDGVTKIGQDAFGNCTSLEKVIISDTVKKVGKYAFRDCDKLSVLYLGKGLTDIEYGAFGSWYRSKTVYYSGTKAEWENIFIDADAFFYSYTVYFERKQPE